MAVVSKLAIFIELKECSVDARKLSDPDIIVQPKKKKKILEHFLEDIMGNSSDTNESQPSETASSEVDRYHTETPLTLACKNPKFCQNPLTWREMRATQYINLLELARKFCAFLLYECPQ